MATINEARSLVYSTFTTGWAGATPIVKGNSEASENISIPWVRIVVRNRVSTIDSKGGVGETTFARSASIILSIFVDIKIGEGAADVLAENFRTIFENKRLSREIWVNDVDTREIGPDGNLYQVNAEGFLTYLQTK